MLGEYALSCTLGNPPLTAHDVVFSNLCDAADLVWYRQLRYCHHQFGGALGTSETSHGRLLSLALRNYLEQGEIALGR